MFRAVKTLYFSLISDGLKWEVKAKVGERIHLLPILRKSSQRGETSGGQIRKSTETKAMFHSNWKRL